MADVAIYCVSGLPIKNNSSISAVMKNGEIHTMQHGFNDITSHDDLETKYTDKWDNPTYYSN